MIDLHAHSTFSDGSFTPSELVDKAVEVGLTALALTDHDTLNGLPSFIEAATQVGLRGIPGVELSVDYSPGTFHVLGYLVDPANEPFEAALSELRDGREQRNYKILKRLNELGYALTWDEVKSYAGEDVVGRPHFSQALIDRGMVKSKDEAFERLLAKGKPAYVDRFRLTAADSIRLIREAGGVAILAHPFSLKLGRSELKRVVSELAGLGLAGLEAWYSEHTQDQQKMYAQLAAELGLITTGGSDFHGAVNPDIHLGYGFGHLSVPDTLIEDLYARAGQSQR